MGSVSPCSRSRQAVDGRGTPGTSDVFPDIDRTPDGVIAGAIQIALAPGTIICIVRIIGTFNEGLTIMVQTTALEFQRKFGEFQHQAQREPVEITRHGRREFVLMSAEQYDWLTAAAKRTHRTADATSVVIDAVERAEMDPEHAALDTLLK